MGVAMHAVKRKVKESEGWVGVEVEEGKKKKVGCFLVVRVFG